MSGGGVGKGVDVKLSETGQRDQKRKDMVVSERTPVMGPKKCAGECIRFKYECCGYKHG